MTAGGAGGFGDGVAVGVGHVTRSDGALHGFVVSSTFMSVVSTRNDVMPAWMRSGRVWATSS